MAVNMEALSNAIVQADMETGTTLTQPGYRRRD